MNIIDLSHPVTESMTVYPGTEQPEITAIANYENDSFLEHRVVLSTHTGTHIDAPAHMLEGGETVEKIELDSFIGSGIAIDCTAFESRTICIDQLADHEQDLADNDFLLLFTGWSGHWNSEEYFCNYPALTAEAASWLAELGLKGIGLDTISVDAHDSVAFTNHRILMESKIIIIENLNNLHLLPGKEFLFSCLPLKLINGDGSPVRAAAIIID